MSPENELANARTEMALGDDALRAAQALLDLDLPNDAVSRAYYAAFHYARALLLLQGLEPKTHRGVAALMATHLEGTGRLSKASVSAFARLQTFRATADYDARGRLTRERAAEEVRAAVEFVEEARKQLAAASPG